MTIAAGCRRFPGAWFELPGAGRIKVLRTTRGEGSGAPGTVLDEHLTIACGEGRGALARGAARRQAADEG
jgi:methionyl-tRNA formyltransferase